MKRKFFIVGLLACLGVLFSFSVLATDTGWKSPTATGSIFDEWVNPVNAYSSNDVWAFKDSSGNQDYYDFNFNIPEDVISIDGIEVSIEQHGLTTSQVSNFVFLSWNEGINLTDHKIIEVEWEIDQITILGSPVDTWGKTWTFSELSNANFRLVNRNNGGGAGQLFVDHIQVKISYTVPEPPEPPIIPMSVGFATGTLAYVGQLFTDLNALIVLVIGLPLGFVVIRKVIGLV